MARIKSGHDVSEESLRIVGLQKLKGADAEGLGEFVERHDSGIAVALFEAVRLS